MKIIIVGIILLIVLYGCGFRITHINQNEFNWEAVSAITNWIGAIGIPLFVVWIQRKWDKEKEDIASSNLETLKQVNEFRERFEHLLDDLVQGNVFLDCGHASEREAPSSNDLRERMIQYITIKMGATLEEITVHLGISTQTTVNMLQSLLKEKIIELDNVKNRKKYKVVHCKKIK